MCILKLSFSAFWNENIRYEPGIIPTHNIYLNLTYLRRGKKWKDTFVNLQFQKNGTTSLSEVKL